MDPELIKHFAMRRVNNIKGTEGFTFSVVGIGCLFILVHLGRSAAHGLQLCQKGGSAMTLVSSPMRMFRKISIHSFPFVPSVGHAAIVTIFVALNLIFLNTFMSNKIFGYVSNIGSRAGWLSIVNMLFSVFLALKNTPLAWLTAWSYERLNVLHRYAGGFAVLHMIIHACTYSAFFAGANEGYLLTGVTIQYGIVAGSCFFLMGITALTIRRWWYEAFYYTHVVLFIVALVMIGLHQPVMQDGFVVMVVLSASLWVLDRLIRISRLALYSTNNSVTLTPLSNGGTRVTLAKAPIGALSGKHCFLWIPSIRKFETHPFTIAAMDPLEFVVTAHDGFTKDLHQRASENPGVTLKASAEGSYGTSPKPTNFDKVVLVAGGTGASFTFGVALNVLKQLKGTNKTQIIFIWTVRHRSLLAWYAKHLSTLTQDSQVSVRLFVTKGAPPAPGKAPSVTESEKRRFDGTRSLGSGEISPAAHSSSASSISGDVEKADVAIHESELDMNSFAGAPIAWSRPDVPSLIRGVVAETPKGQSVLIMGCGPSALMKQVRNTSAECIQMAGPTVELHCEQFGW